MIEIDFKKGEGLIPVIIQDASTNEVLMLGYMNREAWEKTLKTKRASFWSRSRKKLWMKGETSGHFQEVKEIYLDCDGDTLLLKVDQIGRAACHTGFRSCFHHRYERRRVGRSLERESLIPRRYMDSEGAEGWNSKRESGECHH